MNSRAAKTLSIVTSIGIFAYWALVYGGIMPVEPLVPGYIDWFMSFPIADLWIALTALASLGASRKDRKLSCILIAASGSGLIFLGLYAFAYAYQSGLLFQFNAMQAIEILVKLYCLGVGGFFIFSGYRGLSYAEN